MLAGTNVSDSVLRTLWMHRLPTNIQVILTTQKEVQLDQVADLADAITETTGPRVQGAQASTRVPTAVGTNNAV